MYDRLNKDASSLAGSEGSTSLQVVVDVTSACARVERHLCDLALLALDLHKDVLQILDRQRFAFLRVQFLQFFVGSNLELFCSDSVVLSVSSIVDANEEFVVLLVSGQLDGVLVVREQRVVSVR